jgi:lipoprotein
MMIKKLTAALLGVAFVLAGCNTMSGMGQDIQAGGEKLEKKAEDVKHGSSESTTHDAMHHNHGTTAAQPTETMTKEDSSSDSSMWEKTKEKASEIKDSVKEKLSK